MTKLLLSLVLAAILLCSCGGNTGGSNMTSTGFEYKVYKDVPGENLTTGQVAYFNFEIMDNTEKVLQSTIGNPNQPNIALPAKDDPIVKQNPLIALLYHCSLGDSMGLIIPRDSMPNAPPEFKDVEFFEYRVSVTEVLTEEEHKAKIDEQRKVETEKAGLLQAKEGEIASFAVATAADYKAGKLDLKDGPEGIKYVIHEEGSGPNAEPGQFATVQYYGYLEDGTSFDNSYKRGQGFGFKLGQGSVIRGWDIGIPLLNKGAKATLFIPSDIGYGARGSGPNIKPDTDLIFYVELEDVR